VFRLISQDFAWRFVGEASQSCSVVCVDEVGEVFGSVFLAAEGVLAGVFRAFGGAGDGLGDAAVEAFDHAVRLGVKGSCEPMLDLEATANGIERVPA
jgi:hypothetical protein